MVVGEFTTETDLLVIGGGPGGCAAALRASELGQSVIIVDNGPGLGGTWVHAGLMCKELLQLASLVQSCSRTRSMLGLHWTPPEIDFPAVRQRLGERATAESARLEQQCRDNGIEVIRGRARFDDSRRATVAGDTVSRVRFRRAIIATGAQGTEHPDFPFDHPRVLDAAAAAHIKSIPDRVLLLGGTTMALELAAVYALFGSKVTLIDPGDQLLPFADPVLVAFLRSALSSQIEIVVDQTITSSKETETGWTVTFDAHDPIDVSTVIVATRRAAANASLELENTSVQRDADQWIEVNGALVTTDPRLYAIGDAIGVDGLVATARQQGRIAAESIAGWNVEFDARALPIVICTDPPLAWCGLSEATAAATGLTAVTTHHHWSNAGLTMPDNAEAAGLATVVFEPDTGLLLGLGVVGAGAEAFIGEAALAIEMGAVLDDLAAVIHAHPAGEVFTTAAQRMNDPS